MLCSNLDRNTDHLKLLRGCPKFLHQNSIVMPLLGHYCFIPNSFTSSTILHFHTVQSGYRCRTVTHRNISTETLLTEARNRKAEVTNVPTVCEACPCLTVLTSLWNEIMCPLKPRNTAWSTCDGVLWFAFPLSVFFFSKKVITKRIVTYISFCNPSFFCPYTFYICTFSIQWSRRMTSQPEHSYLHLELFHPFFSILTW
jgi:hypothetical protein